MEMRPEPAHKINAINYKCSAISLFLSLYRHVNSMADVPSSSIYKILPEDPLGITGKRLVATAYAPLSLLQCCMVCVCVGGGQTLGTHDGSGEGQSFPLGSHNKRFYMLTRFWFLIWDSPALLTLLGPLGNCILFTEDKPALPFYPISSWSLWRPSSSNCN